jgi:PUCC protein
MPARDALLSSLAPPKAYGRAFVLAGCGIGLSETSESALVARAAPDHLRGSAFGLLGGVQAAGDVVSSVTVGLLYTAVSPRAAFAYAAGWMVPSLGASSLLVGSLRAADPFAAG